MAYDRPANKKSNDMRKNMISSVIVSSAIVLVSLFMCVSQAAASQIPDEGQCCSDAIQDITGSQLLVNTAGPVIRKIGLIPPNFSKMPGYNHLWYVLP